MRGRSSSLLFSEEGTARGGERLGASLHFFLPACPAGTRRSGPTSLQTLRPQSIADVANARVCSASSGRPGGRANPRARVGQTTSLRSQTGLMPKSTFFGLSVANTNSSASSTYLAAAIFIEEVASAVSFLSVSASSSRVFCRSFSPCLSPTNEAYVRAVP